jgi:hypothetical protein
VTERTAYRTTWPTVAAGVVGGLVAAVVCVLATTRVLPDRGLDYTLSDLGWAAAVAALAAVLGVAIGWVVNRRRAHGLGGIAAIVALLGATAGTFAWTRSVGPGQDDLLYLVWALLMLGGGLIGLAAVAGITVAALRPQSRP